MVSSMALILLLALVVVLVISSFQVASFFIGYAGADYGFGWGADFWNTGNFWAWLFMLILISGICLLIKLAAVIVNNIVAAIADAIKGPFGGLLYFGMIGAWLIGAIVGGISLFNWFVSYPELTDWFVGGNWLACILLIFWGWSLVARFNMKDE